MSNDFDELGFSPEQNNIDDEGLGYSVVHALPDGLPNIPNGHDAVPRTFGDFATTRCESGVIRLPEPVTALTELRCHVLIVPVFRAFLEEIHARGHWHLIKTIYGYEQSVRPGSVFFKGLARIALSSWGISLTINRAYNPFDSEIPVGPVGQPMELTTKGQPGFRFYPDHPVVKIAEMFNLVWAGRETWPNADAPGDCDPNPHPDPAVFQYAMVW